MARELPETRQLPRALYRAAQVQALDRAAIEQEGVSSGQLMERAGAAAFSVLRARWPEARSIVVLAGAGNNGGDGYVLARLAHRHQLAVRLLTLGDHQALSGAAAEAAQAFSEAGGSIEPFSRVPPDAEVIVDAMFGTGLARPVTGIWSEAIGQCNAARAAVLALDVPSGLHADTGQILGCAIHATATVSFIGLKQGLFTGHGPDCSGTICFDGLKVPARIYASEVLSARRIDWDQQWRLLPRRRRSAHKGAFGHLLVIGGGPGMSGAARLAGEAALRCGAGRVSVATDPAHAAVLNLTRPELMVHGVREPGELETLLQSSTLIAIGPGLGQSEWALALFERAVETDRPLVLDADALNLLAWAPRRRDDWVLTPHPGEAARLLNASAAEVEADRFAAIQRLQERYGGAVVLKGAGSLVTGPGMRPMGLCPHGNPGMASAGMGDSLTGIIAGLLAQGLEPGLAAEVGVCLHAAAGDRAAEFGQRGLLASDLIGVLQALLAEADGER